MLSFLFSAGLCSVSEQFSLVPPLHFTNLSEIGTWTIRGSASNLKRFVRLTNAIPHTFGGVCQRTPTTFIDWTVELELSIRGGNGGDAMFFAFTRDLCPNISYPIQGFAIVINTTETNADNLSNIYISEPTGSTLIGALALRNDAVRIRIVRRGQHVSLEYGGSSVAVVIAKDASDYGYFSVYGVTTTNTDTNDLYAVRTVPMSRYPQENNGTDVDRWSRKMLDKNVAGRRVEKGVRRSKMVVTQKYLKERDAKEGVLSGGDQKLANALQIISESEVRSQEIVTLKQLRKFVDERIAATIAKAHSKVNLAAEKFDETRVDLSEVWSNLRSQLVGLSVEAKMSMTELGEQVIQAVKELRLDDASQWRFEIAVRRETRAAERGIGQFLFWIALVELVAYIMFFFWKRQKTHGFKKFD